MSIIIKFGQLIVALLISYILIGVSIFCYVQFQDANGGGTPQRPCVVNDQPVDGCTLSIGASRPIPMHSWPTWLVDSASIGDYAYHSYRPVDLGVAVVGLIMMIVALIRARSKTQSNPRRILK